MMKSAPEGASTYNQLNKKAFVTSRLFHYLRPHRVRLFGALVAVLFTSIAILGIGAALKHLVDAGLTSKDVHLLDRSLLFFSGVIVVLALASYARVYNMMKVSEEFIADLRRDAFARLLAMEAAFFERHTSGDLVSRFTSDASLLQQIMVSSLSVTVRNILLFVGGIIMLMHTSSALTLMVVLLLCLVIPPIIILGKRVRLYARKTQDALGALQSCTEENISHMRIVQAMAAEQATKTAYDERLNTNVMLALQRTRAKALLISSVIFLVFGSIISVLWFGGHQVIKAEMTAGQLTAFIFYSVMVAGAVAALSEVSTDLQRAGAALSRMFELLELKPAIAAPARPIALPDLTHVDIRFNHVHFAYPSRPHVSALHDFSLHIQAGETVALVGASGAGKSTIFQLLLRFYDPGEGDICVGEYHIKNFDPGGLRRAIGLVPQDPHLFSASISENVKLGLQVSDEEVIQALHAANAMEFIERLPDGLNAYAGERGVQLSGGQKQRIAIARTLLRNPAILLLDEATSALDSENEQLVNAALERLMQGRTSLVIAHRLSTVQRADRIVLMHEGRIEAIGTHESLMGESERYHRLVSLQFGKCHTDLQSSIG